jgi:fatty acid desaturase
MNDKQYNLPKEIINNPYIKDIRQLSIPNTLYTLGQLAFEWFGIVLMVVLCLKFWSIPLYLFSLIFISSRQHALGVIMHDGVHYRISKNRKINDLIASFFVAYPMFRNLHNIRKIHFLHHRNPNTTDDPDWITKKDNNEWEFPQSKFQFLFNVLKYIGGLHLLCILFNKNNTIKNKITYILSAFSYHGSKRKNIKSKNNINWYKFSYYLLFFVSIVYFGYLKWFLMFWILPGIVWTPFISRLRTISEHFGVENKNIYNTTRTLYPSIMAKYILSANWNITYHIDHHLYPSVPSYNIKKLHNILKNIPQYNKHAHITKGSFYGLYKECTK